MHKVLVIKDFVKTLEHIELKFHCSVPIHRFKRVCELKYERKMRIKSKI